MARYGRLVDGRLETLDWRTVFIVDGTPTLLNDPEALLARGWRQLVFAECPEAEAGYIHVSGWAEAGGQLVQTWRLESAASADPTQEERIEALESAMLELLEVIANG